MTRYIDADKLKEDILEENSWYLYNEFGGTTQFHELIDNAPTADVVEVVRCGECKYMHTDGKCDAFADFSIRPSVSDYCSYGKRKQMSVSKWAYSPEKCDGQPCVGDCDMCPKAYEGDDDD